MADKERSSTEEGKAQERLNPDSHVWVGDLLVVPNDLTLGGVVLNILLEAVGSKKRDRMVVTDLETHAELGVCTVEEAVERVRENGLKGLKRL